jgi:hypothetical protein
MGSPVPSRGTRRDNNARLGRQAPLSGRQGALVYGRTNARKPRPVDTIAEARKLAEETA